MCLNRNNLCLPDKHIIPRLAGVHEVMMECYPHTLRHGARCTAPTQQLLRNGGGVKGPSTLATLFSHRWRSFCGGDIYSRRKPLFSSFGEHTAVCGSSVRQAVARPRHRQSVCIHNIHVAATCRPSVLGSATKTRPPVAKQSGQCARALIEKEWAWKMRFLLRLNNERTNGYLQGIIKLTLTLNIHIDEGNSSYLFL